MVRSERAERPWPTPVLHRAVARYDDAELQAVIRYVVWLPGAGARRRVRRGTGKAPQKGASCPPRPA